VRERLWEIAKTIEPEVVADRRWLHQHAELSYQEKETSAYIAEQLRKLGHDPQVGIGGYGIKVVLSGKRPGPTIALRADMDALPIQEETGLPFASVNPGVMHACGHDCHVAMLLGAARGLTLMEGDWAGNVVLIFQPAEEQGPGGASLMIKDGVLRNPDVEAIFGLHVNAMVPAGRLGFAPGPMKAASDKFEIVVRGKGGHGAHPNLTRDPILAASYLVQALQQVVSRNVAPSEPAVISVGSIHGGEAPNVIPSEVVLTGTIRTMGEPLRTQIREWMKRVIDGAVAAHGCQAEVEFVSGYPAVHNDPEQTECARRAAESILPKEEVDVMEMGMGAEDFAYYLEKVPGTIGRLGVAPSSGELFPLHSSRLRVDESALTAGVAFWLSLVQEACRAQ
jgi:amidohydrolase